MTQIIGFTAATIGALAFFPQVAKTWRTRSSQDLSIGMLLALTTGASLWVWYGLSIGSAPVTAGNAVTLSLCVCLLIMKLRWDGW